MLITRAIRSGRTIWSIATSFFFGVSEDFPREMIPAEAGLIVADGFNGAVLRDTAARPLAGARRKAVTLLFARLAAARLNGF